MIPQAFEQSVFLFQSDHSGGVEEGINSVLLHDEGCHFERTEEETTALTRNSVALMAESAV